jgi:hypothetical protein
MADQACKSNNHSGFEEACPGVALPPSNLEGTTEVGVPVLGVAENSATTIARGRAIKRKRLDGSFVWRRACACAGYPLSYGAAEVASKFRSRAPVGEFV